MDNINIPKALRKLSEYLEDEPSEQALLTEYQACQQYNSSSSQSYWTLTGIFIGFSSVLLGSLLYGFTHNKERLILGIVTCVISVAVLLILYFLNGWLKRVSFLQQMNFYRMRDIERALGMWASWRVHGVDNWKDKDFDTKKIPCREDRKRLLKYKPLGYEQRNFWQYWSDKQRYEGSSDWHYNGIFCVLFILWSLVLLGGLYSLFSYSCDAISIATIILAIIGVILFLYRRHIWPFREQKV